VQQDSVQFDTLKKSKVLFLSSLSLFLNVFLGINTIVVNDNDPEAVAAIKRNLEYNNIDLNSCIPNLADAKALMYQNAFDDSKR
jgi:hypothetical protein